MGAEPMWFEATFLPNQALPSGYVVGGEWGDIGDWKSGFGCWYWVNKETDEIGPPMKNKWEARRSAIEHAKQQQKASDP